MHTIIVNTLKHSGFLLISAQLACLALVNQAFGQVYSKLSPFTEVKFIGESVQVTYGDHSYELLSANGLSTGELVSFCKTNYKSEWQEALALRLVEVLTRMGKRPGDDLVVLPRTKVPVRLRDPSTKEQSVVNAPLRYDYYRQLDRSFVATDFGDGGEDLTDQDPFHYRVSPFQSMTIRGDQIIVEFNGDTLALKSIQGVTAKALLKRVRQYGPLAERHLCTLFGKHFQDLGGKYDEHVSFEVIDLKTNQVKTVSNAEMNQENYNRVVKSWWHSEQARKSKSARQIVQEKLANKSQQEILRLLVNDFERRIREEWAFRDHTRDDIIVAIDSVLQSVNDGMDGRRCLIELKKALALGIDGHSSIDGDLPQGYLPFRIDISKGRLVAFRPDRSDFVVADHPFITHLDGRPVEEWIAAAIKLIPHGETQATPSSLFVSPGYLNYVTYLRAELGLEDRKQVDVTFTSLDEASQVHKVFPVSKTMPFPLYERWPSSPFLRQGDVLRKFKGDIGYCRLEMMNEQALHAIMVAMDRFRNASGLIIDVRANGGGGADINRCFLPYLLEERAAPEVVSASFYPVGQMHPDNKTRPINLLSKEEQRAVNHFMETFKPEWNLPTDDFANWTFEVISRSDNPKAYHFDKPIVVLHDSKCGSMGEWFLSALKGHSNVTLVGTTSHGAFTSGPGGSLLDIGEIDITLASSVYFDRHGRMLEGKGVEPDIVVEPVPEYFIGKRDNALEKALEVLTPAKVK